MLQRAGYQPFHLLSQPQLALPLIEQLAIAMARRDASMGEPLGGVGALAARVARHLGVPRERTELLRRAARLRDVGTLAVPEALLRKQGPLTAEEWRVVRRHTVTGARMLRDSESAVLRLAAKIAWSHHERWDGTGALRLRGTAIPLAGRIVAVADAFHALTHARPHRPAWSAERALDEIQAQRGRHFDPEVVEAFPAALQSLSLAVEFSGR